MAAEKLTAIELDSIALHETKPRTLAPGSSEMGVVQEDDIETGLGLVHVMVQGDRHKPAILTYHDIGLSSVTCFQGFFSCADMQPILKHFCVYHMTAPGQQEGALPLPQGIGYTGDAASVTSYQYPTMDQLAEMILPVMQFYNLKRILGFGVGAGANILARFALKYADRVEALVLINCTAGKAGWSEWGYQKWNTWYLKSGTMTASVEEYLLWHWFGERTMETNHDLVTAYSSYMKSINPPNLAHFIESYVKRTDLGIQREIDISKKDPTKTIKCPVLMIAGDYSPHLDDTVNMNGRMDPSNCQWMKFECGGMVLEEAPEKVTEAFRLFIQGMGYVPSMSQTRLVAEKSAMSRTSLLGGATGGEVKAQAVC